jgi:hypothetical protein
MDLRTWKYFIHIRAGMLFAALRVGITQYPGDDAWAIVDTMNALFAVERSKYADVSMP